MPQCATCDEKYGSLRSLRNHHLEEHSGEVWTPEEYLPSTESQQRDFHGDVPDDSDHAPRVLAEPREPVSERTERTGLSEFFGGDASE